jgi:hypothetical protein
MMAFVAPTVKLREVKTAPFDSESDFLLCVCLSLLIGLLVRLSVGFLVVFLRDNWCRSIVSAAS